MKPQIIYENERPAFVVLPYQEYMQQAIRYTNEAR